MTNFQIKNGNLFDKGFRTKSFIQEPAVIFKIDRFPKNLKSFFGKPLYETIVARDINGDCKVDFIDMLILLSHWLEEY